MMFPFPSILTGSSTSTAVSHGLGRNGDTLGGDESSKTDYGGDERKFHCDELTGRDLLDIGRTKKTER
jgi:hypothetical protein